MSKSRRFALIGLIATTVVALVGLVVGMAAVRAHGSGNSTARELSRIFHGSPKAVLVGVRIYDIGVIDKPAEYTHKYIIRNEGDAPLELARGPSTCSCTLTGLPEKPIPPGEQGVVSIGFNEAHKDDVLKPGLLDRGVTVFTNDPSNEKILLGLIATVRRRLAAEPSLLTFNIHATDADAELPHSATAMLYSQTWDRFELGEGKCSIPGVEWTVEPASREDLQPQEAKSGYRIRVTLPPAMSDGRISGGIDFDVRPENAEKQSFHLDLQARWTGISRCSAKNWETGHSGSKVLLWGSLPRGQAAKENVILKINSEPKTLTIERIETEPAFLRAEVVPVGEGTQRSGVYRIELEIPRDAPACNHMEEGQLGVVRIATDHPRFPLIELKVFFAVVGGK